MMIFPTRLARRFRSSSAICNSERGSTYGFRSPIAAESTGMSAMRCVDVADLHTLSTVR